MESVDGTLRFPGDMNWAPISKLRVFDEIGTGADPADRVPFVSNTWSVPFRLTPCHTPKTRKPGGHPVGGSVLRRARQRKKRDRHASRWFAIESRTWDRLREQFADAYRDEFFKHARGKRYGNNYLGLVPFDGETIACNPQERE